MACEGTQPLGYIAEHMLVQCHRVCSKIRRDQAENNHEITVEVQGDYPNFKQNIAEKKFSHRKSH